MKRVLLLLVMVALAVMLAVLPAAGQSLEGCNGLVKAFDQQSAKGKDGVNDKLFFKAHDRCDKIIDP